MEIFSKREVRNSEVGIKKNKDRTIRNSEDRAKRAGKSREEYRRMHGEAVWKKVE